MNIAFPALVVLLLLLPGVLLSYAYRRGFFRKTPVTLGPLRDEIGPGIVWALLLHIISLALLHRGFGWMPDPQIFFGLVDGEPGSGEARGSGGAVAELFTYLASLNGAAFMLGWSAHGIVRWLKLDLRYDWLRFSNEWFYLFSGEARVFETDQSKRDVPSIRMFVRGTSIDVVFDSAVVEQGDGAMLYWGLLSDYFFDAEGKLDKIVLQEAQRRRLATDADDGEAQLPVTDERFYPIRGNYLVIRYTDVLNLNIEYVVLDDPNAGDAAAEKDDVETRDG